MNDAIKNVLLSRQNLKLQAGDFAETQKTIENELIESTNKHSFSCASAYHLIHPQYSKIARSNGCS